MAGETQPALRPRERRMRIRKEASFGVIGVG
jgi:hypothetical protein